MPILNPADQNFLLDKKSNSESEKAIFFYCRFLKIASHNINKSFATIEAAVKFKNHLQGCVPLVSEIFKCQLLESDILNPTLNNIYKYLYDCITKTTNEKLNKKQKSNGYYFKLSNIYESYFYEPDIFFSKQHSWFFSDTPIAILTVNFMKRNESFPFIHLFSYFSQDKKTDNEMKDLYQIIMLETYLMLAAGYTLVLCIKYNIDFDFQFDLINCGHFAEIHMTFDTVEDIEDFSQKKQKLQSINGFLYIYAPFLHKYNIYKDSYKPLKKIPHIRILTFSLSPFISLIKPIFQESPPFAYCKSGFKYKYLRISLSNVPIYGQKDDNETFVPTEMSGLTQCYISPDDFLNWKNERVKIIYDDGENNLQSDKYINFEDLHLIRKDFYVNDPLQVGNVKDKNFEIVNELEKNIQDTIERRKNKKFKKDHIKSIFKENQIRDLIKKVTYAYAYCEHSLDNDFSIHRPQIYTALKASHKFFYKNDELIKDFKEEEKMLEKHKFGKINIHIPTVFEIANALFDVLGFFTNSFEKDLPVSLKIISICSQYYSEKSMSELISDIKTDPKKFFDDLILNQKNRREIEAFQQISAKVQKNVNACHKGVVYQVETGEGKSCIICLIAAILALKGKTVHISSSNIKLANRDYMDSFDFFRILGLKSAVLLHKNELPIPPKKSDTKKKKSTNENIDLEEVKGNKTDSNDMNINKNNEQNDNGNSKESIENDDIEISSFFKDNINNYFNENIKDNKTEYARYYHDIKYDYFTEEQFKNSSKMNFSVCGLDNNNKIPKNKPNVIFSTFVNFECFYLKMMEICPGYIDEYYDNCGLLIDEADSILIDEITNGTIVSRDVKSNSTEVLKFVYNKKKEGVSESDTLGLITKQWPKCADLKLKDVIRMYKEIDLVLKKDEFQDGKKYTIETFEVKNDKKKKRLKNEVLNLAKDIGVKVVKGLIKDFSSGKNDEKNEKESDENEENDDNDDDDDDDDGEDGEEEDDDDEEQDDSPTTIFRRIVPFDYAHKGISEPNKEFSGFIQQFIAIKESEKKENTNMLIKEMSMNYLFVSHPIFVKLYSKVCGFTGTIGGKREKDIYKKQYSLKTVRIPRNSPNRRVELPMILCNSVEERNKNIVFEVFEFHKKRNPVLVIFQDLKEIDQVAELIIKNGIHFINIFNGKNDIIKPEKIAGVNGAVSLGTNFCGRGTNIIAKGKPLHVIISYFSSNVRVMNQAHGRTARQGRPGTSRIICLKNQFLNPKAYKDDGVNNILDEFTIKNGMQMNYIINFQKKKPWIFSNDIDKQKFSKDDITTMRNAKINVNRTVAFNFEFPLKMSIETFLAIQAQKIFSLFNCPNSKYTWRIFQKYVREMILESWSIMINNFDEEFFDKNENKEYRKQVDELNDLHLDVESSEYEKKRELLNNKFIKNIENYQIVLNEKMNELIGLIEKYLPSNLNDVVPSFMFIFNKVVETYETNVITSFNPMGNCYLQNNKYKFVSCQVGFKPYSLLTESGARITYKNFKKTNYIKDPELKYMKLTPKKHLCLLSITEKIDDLFNLIFKKINEVLGNKTFLKFFMRRTLCGCEFGICLNFNLKNEGIDDPNCIVDFDPLLLFTISVKSIIPILAGILIILLIYVASISKEIGEWFVAFPEKFTKEMAKRALGIALNIVAPELVNFGMDKVIIFLEKTLNKQIKKLRSFHDKKADDIANIIDNLKLIFNSSIGEKVNKKFADFLGGKIKVTMSWQKLMKNCFDPERIMKISFYLLLCLGTFLMGFNLHKHSIDRSKSDSAEFEESFKSQGNKNVEVKDKKKMNQAIKNIKSKEVKILKKKGILVINPVEESFENNQKDADLTKQMKNKSTEVSQTYLFEFNTCDIISKIVKIADFIDDAKSSVESITNGVAAIRKVVRKGAGKKECLKMIYNGFTKAFRQQVRFYETNKFPSINEVVGYSVRKKKQVLFVKYKSNGSLENLISSRKIQLNNTNKLIIAYGIASALKYLHSHNVIHRNLNPANIVLDSNLYPYLNEFYYAKQIEIKSPYILMSSTPGFMPPEFLCDSASHQNSFEIDVYSFGVTLFILIAQLNPFVNMSSDDIEKNVKDGFKPQFPKNFGENWMNLIHSCLDLDQKKRPSFKKICDILESDKFVNNEIDIKAFNKYKKKFISFK